MPVSTDTLMQIALDMTGWDNVPGDSGIHVPSERIGTLLVGVDIDTGDLLLARELGYDAVLAHAATGTDSMLTAWQVYHRHVELMTAAGVPRYTAENVVLERIMSLRVAAHRANYDRVSGAAHLMGMPFLNIQSPVDELGRKALQRAVDDLLRANSEATVGEVCAHLNASFPEFQHAPTQIAVRMGATDLPAGRTVVIHGTAIPGDAAVSRTYLDHGVDTVICTSIAPAELQKLERHSSGNLIVTGQIAGVSIGLNIYLEQLESLGVEVTRLNGVLPNV